LPLGFILWQSSCQYKQAASASRDPRRSQEHHEIRPEATRGAARGNSPAEVQGRRTCREPIHRSRRVRR
ncbi:MAG: hypothetical protein AAEJ52_15830, partial [Myxococcota bacterium]